MKLAWLGAALAGLMLAFGCGSELKTYRLSPPAPGASASAPVASAQAWRAERPEPGTPGVVRFPVPDIVELASGLRVYLVPTDADVVTIRFVVRHGASSIVEGKSGLAALTARMMTEGTRRRSSLELAEAAESLGSSLESDAGRDESSIGISALAMDLDRALALLAEVATEPAFDRKEFERVRAEWIDGLLAERQTPDRLASLAGLRLLNGPHHGAPVGGGVSDVKRITAADLAEFHARFWQPESSALILVGRFDPTAVKTSAERHFAAFRQRRAPTPPSVKVPSAPARLRIALVDRPGAVQSAIFGAQRFPERSAPGHEARELLSEVVGGLFTSRINQNLREKHAYTYGARGRAVATRYWGAFVVSTSVRTDVTAPAIEQLLLELKKARDPALGAPLAPAELDRGRKSLLNTLGARLEHTSRVADAVKSEFVAELGADYHARYPSLIQSVSQSDVAEAAKLLAPERMVFVIAGDKARIAPELDRIGADIEDAPESAID